MPHLMQDMVSPILPIPANGEPFSRLVKRRPLSSTEVLPDLVAMGFLLLDDGPVEQGKSAILTAYGGLPTPGDIAPRAKTQGNSAKACKYAGCVIKSSQWRGTVAGNKARRRVSLTGESCHSPRV